MANFGFGELEQQSLYLMFGENFLEDHARRIISDPKIALVELVANCWDAGADRVNITWPTSPRPEKIAIGDNGTGLTQEQFSNRWLALNYNRNIEQGEGVEFPTDNEASKRKAFGRNGKGRHAIFCFANSYYVETWRDGTASVFEVFRTSGMAKMPYEIHLVNQYPKEGHGTIVSAELVRNHLSVNKVKDLLGSKFVTDPTFRVHVNGELLELTNLEHLIDRTKIIVPRVGSVIVSQVDTQRTSRTSHPHGVAWWVNKRLVGEPSWKNFTDSGILDRRTIRAKRFTFIVEADILEDDVREDWSGFRSTREFLAVQTAVESHIRGKLMELMQDIHKAQKTAAIEDNRRNIENLPAISRHYVGQMIDGIQEVMPSIKQKTLSATVSVLSNLERARTGYSLLDQLAQLGPDELDTLNEILDEWSVHDALIVLSELERRLKIISGLEQLIEDPTSDELHDLQPLFERGLWIFGPEYESIHFTSNRTLATVIRNLFKDTSGASLPNHRKRPDFVVLPDASISVHSSDAFDDNSEVNGYDKILVVELKKGGSRITHKECDQGHNYARELRKSGKVQKQTKIIVFVLGARVSEEAEEDVKQGNTTVSARTYNIVLRQAHARTFHLHEKIAEMKSEALIDPDVEQVLASPHQRKFSYPEGTEQYKVIG